MKDVDNQEISVGDKVVFIQRMHFSGVLRVGHVLALTPKMVRVSYVKSDGTVEDSVFAPSNIAIINKY